MNPIARKATVATVLVFFITLLSCKKEAASPTANNLAAAPDNFITYTIQQGQQYCDQEALSFVSLSQLNFKVRFDSTCIYNTVNPHNQMDINKLYGFSDNNEQHHAFSARFGWRWYQNRLNLLAYVYNDSVRTFKDLGNIDIGKTYACAINVLQDHYDFVLEDNVTSMPRTSTTPKAEGYKLLPYFGGDELAPHKINIYIEETLPVK